ncbi:hypothetical protein K432DRAFT_460226 [Lepidopterella palustris CBS 459.81]|uniref:Uncharacterized protein n=1 Tax=Lepidopterella palustris CBS 459.81 TaxID=1314670 RepID=A0A8E2EJ62_9PEZI|nr:hypothetical protein K432DRAFT_460226 [Lepidopterella palustris CBS 459.81]
MRERWPAAAGYFGLKGVEPSADSDVLLPGRYTEEHASALEQRGVKGRRFLRSASWILMVLIWILIDSWI